MLVPLVLLFIAVPLVELYVIIQVGQEIGALPTIAILVADSLIGSALLRSQGRGAWRRFNEALAARRPPAREVIDGALIIFGGALLLTPGFVTDIVGLVLLVPPSRALVRGLLVRRLGLRMLGGLTGAAARRAEQRTGPTPGSERPEWPRGGGRRGPYDVEGSAVEVDDPELDKR